MEEDCMVGLQLMRVMGGSSDNDGDPEWGTAGAKHFDCWNSWDD